MKSKSSSRWRTGFSTGNPKAYCITSKNRELYEKDNDAWKETKKDVQQGTEKVKKEIKKDYNKAKDEVKKQLD